MRLVGRAEVRGREVRGGSRMICNDKLLQKSMDATRLVSFLLSFEHDRETSKRQCMLFNGRKRYVKDEI